MEVFRIAGALVVGLGVLVWSADRFVDGAAAIARRLGMSQMLIGMLVVGFGTSLPEMIVSATAALGDAPELALGNAIGSNITNVCLILGVTALINPILAKRSVVTYEIPVLLGTMVLFGCLAANGWISRWNAVLMLAAFGFLTWISVRRDASGGAEEPVVKELSLVRGSVYVVAGLGGLVLSSKLLVWGAIALAKALGLSDLVIGLTIVALGTSLPELASSVAAAWKGQHDIALGNVLGSNLFNLLCVIGIAGVLKPIRVIPAIFWRDVPTMALTTIFLWAMSAGFRGRQGRVNRKEGGVLLLVYVVYTYALLRFPL